MKISTGSAASGPIIDVHERPCSAMMIFEASAGDAIAARSPSRPSQRRADRAHSRMRASPCSLDVGDLRLTPVGARAPNRLYSLQTPYTTTMPATVIAAIIMTVKGSPRRPGELYSLT
jgi:hypothetical protein